MCWICNTFVSLNEYELGHIIDRCNGGHDDYDNLAVMHKACNLAKPRHETLEEAMKWKLTAFMSAIQQSRGLASRLPKITLPYKRQPLPICSEVSMSYHQRKRQRRQQEYIEMPIIYTNPNRTPAQQKAYDEQILKIKPATICWKQGNPLGSKAYFAPMYRLLPPPYRPCDMFIMRETPPGYIEMKISGKSSIRDTLQIIGGELSQDVNIDLGCIRIHIATVNGKARITFNSGVNANIGEQSKTIGLGKGQILIKAWRIAKSQGISLQAFIASQNLLS